MAKDVDLMAKNAKTYNEPGSQVFKVNSFSRFFSFDEMYSNIPNIYNCSLLYCIGC